MCSFQEHPNLDQAAIPGNHSTYTDLQHRLASLSEDVEELLHMDSDGEIDLIDITPDKVERLKRKLEETRAAVNLWAQGLEGGYSLLILFTWG